MLSPRVPQVLRYPVLIENLLVSTEGAAEAAGFVSSDTYELKMTNRDKPGEIVEKKHSTGG